MNISELSVSDRVLISRRPAEKEVVKVKGFTPKGTIIIRDMQGRMIEITPEQILKKF